MKDILLGVKKGSISVDEAEALINQRFLEADKRTVLDIWRQSRFKVPEIVLADVKPYKVLEKILVASMRIGHPAIYTRIREEDANRLTDKASANFPSASVQYSKVGRVLAVTEHGYAPAAGVRVGVLTAGTSDVPVAEEARIILESLGADVKYYYDVGAAGLHRLYDPMQDIIDYNPASILVFAGREGVLPTLISGLTDIPVIGVPVSVGYGHMGRGESALASMLQSCSPLAVVNIDGGAVAAILALKIGIRVVQNK